VSEVGAYFPGNVVYDQALKELFFSNPAMNEVEAFSTVDGHRVGAVTVPGAVGLSLAPDGSELAVGTNTPHIFFVDPATMHVTRQVEIPATVLNPDSGLEPVLPILMASGPVLIETANPNSIAVGGNLLSYDPVNGTFAQANPPGASGIYGGPPARSLDGKYLAVPTSGQTALQMAVYSAETQSYIGATPGQYDIRGVAANPDGSQFVTVGTASFSSPGQSITFWNRSLQQVAQYPTQDDSVVYSRDGKYLYAREPLDVLALDTQTGLAAGYQGLSLGTNQPGKLWDTDENHRVFGISNLGAFVSSVAQLQPTAPLMPVFSEESLGTSIGNPNEGPLSGGTKVQFFADSMGAGSADGISSTMQAYFGSTPASNDVVAPSASTSDGRNGLTATAPPAAATGPVTILMTDANNNAVLLPGAYSYGPHSRWIDPSALSPTGGAPVTLWADGVIMLASLAPMPTVTIGGNLARTAPLPVVGADLWHGILVTAPGGSPGWADLKISLPDGTSETTKNMVLYLAHDVTLTTPAFTSAVYDASRNRFYLSGADNTIGVFDPSTQTLLQPMQSSKISSGAMLGSLAVTPDNSKLLVSDPDDHSVVVFDLTSGTSTAVNVLLPSDGSATISAPMPVATLAGNRAFVLLTPWAQNELREIDLTRMSVRVRTDVQNASQSSVSPSTIASSTDGSMALLGGASSGSYPPFYAWKYDAESDAFSMPMNISYAQGDAVAVNGDGTVLESNALVLDQNLLPLVPVQYPGISNRLTASGGLRYSASNGVQISDTRSGRSLLNLPLLSNWATMLAIDPSGRKILASAGTSLRYYELAVVPLAVATVSPAEAPPGASITIRGNGFVAGTTATIAGKSASCTLVDEQTLQCMVPNVSAGLAPMTLSNPDGKTYSLEAAISVN